MQGSRQVGEEAWQRVLSRRGVERRIVDLVAAMRIRLVDVFQHPHRETFERSNARRAPAHESAVHTVVPHAPLVWLVKAAAILRGKTRAHASADRTESTTAYTGTRPAPTHPPNAHMHICAPAPRRHQIRRRQCSRQRRAYRTRASKLRPCQGLRRTVSVSAHPAASLQRVKINATRRCCTPHAVTLRGSRRTSRPANIQVCKHGLVTDTAVACWLSNLNPG